VSTYICPVVNGKVLLYKRLKHPQYGYTGFISEKMKFGENMLNAAKRGLLEETSLRADLRLIGNLRQIRKNNKGDVIEDGVFFIFYTDKVEGTLKEKDKEGEYFWAKLNDVASIKKLFKPSVEIVLKEITFRLKEKIGWDSMFIHELEPNPEAY
jgi:ADP-ribose pyrophosphatase YjhB (NUDIX family)